MPAPSRQRVVELALTNNISLAGLFKTPMGYLALIKFKSLEVRKLKSYLSSYLVYNLVEPLKDH